MNVTSRGTEKGLKVRVCGRREVCVGGGEVCVGGGNMCGRRERVWWRRVCVCGSVIMNMIAIKTLSHHHYIIMMSH